MTDWRGRRVFVTGHTGFKGGWLSLWLHGAGARVFGYALPPDSEPNLFTAAAVNRITDGVMADVRDLAALREAMSGHRAEVVFHLAAQSLVRRGYAQPIDTYSTNVMGTAHVLEAARQCECVRAVLIITTDKCYANLEQARGYREPDRLGGDDPYSSSKACAELVAHAYREAFTATAGNGAAPPIATARAGNVIGGGDWAADRLIPDAVRAFAAGETLAVRAPDSVRPWQHVLEPLSGYITLAEKLLDGRSECADAFNFGPDQAHTRTVRDITEAVAGLWGGGANWRHDPQPHPRETRRLALDSGKARAVLDWRPLLDLDSALEMTVAWYKAHAKGLDMERVTREQIDHYREMAKSKAA